MSSPQKTYYRLIAPQWLLDSKPGTKKVLEGLFTDSEIEKHNAAGYNIYWLPNDMSKYDPSRPADGTDIDRFTQVFVDFDIKNTDTTKDEFLEKLFELAPEPTTITDSGNGIHVYWEVSDLDAMSYLRFSRRLIKLLDTDTAVGQLFQLMRTPGTNNTKDQNNFKICKYLLNHPDTIYTAEQLDQLLPPIELKDEEYCKQHYDRTYGLNQEDLDLDFTMPPKFGALIKKSKEAKLIWSGSTDDRSKDDYRLGHIMFANDFTKQEALSVLLNSAKASQRAPIHRVNYAKNIVDKIWTYEETEDKTELNLSSSVESILKRSGTVLKGTPFPCHKRIDNTEHGFRLGQVLGLVAGSGVGKTAFALNLFRWFAQENPDYHHMFIPLEQPANEIADRWRTMCGDDESLNSKIHVMSNYDEQGNYRHLSLAEIADYIIKWQIETGHKLGCVVIDHIGVLKKKGSNDENQDLITLCQTMKAFAVQTNTFLVMQSQTSREKAGIGDLELNKDAAYGTMQFEAFCDFLITLWQPLKRCNSEPQCPTVTAFKYCKIRHKRAKKDVIQEDVPYYLYFDSEKEQLRDMTQDEETQFSYFVNKATNLRKVDRKTGLVTYKSVPYKDVDVSKTNSN